MIGRMFAASRYLILIAVVGAFLASASLLVYGGLVAVSTIVNLVLHPVLSADGAKHLAVTLVEVMDLLLLGTVFLIISLALYDLFIDSSVPLPEWLHIEDLDELKSKLLSVVVVLLTVSFLGEVVDWNGSSAILSLGLAIGAVLLGLGFLTSFPGLRIGGHRRDPEE